MASSPVSPEAATLHPGTQARGRCEARVKLLLERGLCKLPGRPRIQPVVWSREDVLHWLRWAEQEYSLQHTGEHSFEMNGRALCILTKDDFRLRAPAADALFPHVPGGSHLEQVTCCTSYSSTSRPSGKP